LLRYAIEWTTCSAFALRMELLVSHERVHEIMTTNPKVIAPIGAFYFNNLFA
jgi:hypothetical protein